MSTRANRTMATHTHWQIAWKKQKKCVRWFAHDYLDGSHRKRRWPEARGIHQMRNRKKATKKKEKAGRPSGRVALSLTRQPAILPSWSFYWKPYAWLSQIDMTQN